MSRKLFLTFATLAFVVSAVFVSPLSLMAKESGKKTPAATQADVTTTKDNSSTTAATGNVNDIANNANINGNSNNNADQSATAGKANEATSANVAAQPELNNQKVSVDPNTIPFLQKMLGDGGRAFPLGEYEGISGWLFVKDGRVQFTYLTADKKSVIIGAIFDADGKSITGTQIANLLKTNQEVALLIGKAAKQQGEVMRAGASPEGFAATPSSPSSPSSAKQPGSMTVALSPGERLIADLQAAGGVLLGKNEQAEILMVVDTDCPFCHATWKELRDSVLANKLQVRLVPISNSIFGDSLRSAARLLEAKDPLAAWDGYVAGNKKLLDGAPGDLAQQAVISNRVMADRWNIKSTPYLVYRSKDGKVKIVQGRPDRMASVLNDLIVQ